MALAAYVVVPARDEEAWIEQCLQALATQTISTDAFATIVVLDACRDETDAVARGCAAALGLTLILMQGSGTGVGAARRIGMEAACTRLLEGGAPQGLIACTDADSRPAPDWLERQLAHVAAGAQAVAGLIELDEASAALLRPGVTARRDRDAADRLAGVRRLDPTAGHHHFAGASLGVTAAAYRRVGGIDPLSAHEDAAFARRLAAHDVCVLRAADVRVRTSTRLTGRVPQGLSVDLAVSSWFLGRRYRATDYPLEAMRRIERETSVTVIIPTKECAETIGAVIDETVGPLIGAGLVDELLVVDAGSADGTAAVAQAAGARVRQQDDLMPEFGPALGKGDAMWRGLQDTSGEIVCFLDGDTADPDVRHLLGLLGPLLTDRSLSLVKGAFERPLRVGGTELAHEGGRVTELMARPLINFHEPLLAGFSQPLAGEFAARRELLETASFPTGYGVEIALLIDALRACGLDGLAECDLGTRQNRHQPLRALGEMAFAVLVAMENRLPGRADSGGPGRYLRPWEDGARSAVATAERKPVVAGQRTSSWGG